MPGFTRKYGLAYFLSGEIYSARYDKQRFTILDNQFDFWGDIIGDGILNGWDITDESIPSSARIKISPGSGFIEHRATFTYCDIYKNLSNTI